jgi:hypothetical protein
MTIGDPRTFAVESIISEAYLREGLRALGCFVIHVGGGRYGVYRPNATLLGCSFDEVAKRMRQRGLHVAPFAKAENPGMIADAFREAIYSENAKNEYFGIPRDRFCDLVYSSDIFWARYGDEAFDDGSYVLQFDVGDRVRLMAFRCGVDWLHDPSTLREVWIAGSEYYQVLAQWRLEFEMEWKSLPKKEI